MSVSFFQPVSFTNGSNNDLSFQFSNNGSDLKPLFSSGPTLQKDGSYVSEEHPDANPDQYGCWIPAVSSQAELNLNYAQVQNVASTAYLFFKVSASNSVLHSSPTLSNGFSVGTPVPVVEGRTPYVAVSNIGSSRLEMNNSDGPVIVIGITDTGGDNDRR